MFDYIKPLIGSLASFAKKRMGFQHPPRLFLKQDLENSNKALGRTAYYDPQEQSVTLYITARHPKDILRSFSHELVHHTQNLRGDLSPEKIGMMTKNYAQDNDHMRNMEKEAYLQGNMCFRDWEDTIEDKDKILIKLAESKFLKENKTMTTKITKEFLEEEIKRVLKEFVGVGPEDLTTADPIEAAQSAIGLMNKNPPIVPNFSAIKATHAALLKMNSKEADETAKNYVDTALKKTRNINARLALDALSKKTAAQIAGRADLAKRMKKAAKLKRFQKAAADAAATASQAQKGLQNVLNVKEENEEGAFAPSHYCIHHGGVQHEGAIHQGEAIGHNWDEELGKVTHYDMKLPDGTILEDVAAEDILVTKASLAEGSHTLIGECEHKKHDVKKKNRKKSKAKKFAMNQKPYDKATALDRKGDDGVPKKIKMKAIAEEKVSMVEAEKALYEERFGNRNNKLFEHLIKNWTK